jgi:hypothetical protein
MEIASSVRAATRANQARRLLRERETASDVKTAVTNNVIGQGSIPAGWAEAAARGKAARDLEAKAAEALKGATHSAHGAAGAFKELMVVIREGARGDFKKMFSSLSILGTRVGLGLSSMAGIGAVLAIAGAAMFKWKEMKDAEAEEGESDKRLEDGNKTVSDRLRHQLENLEKAGKITHDQAVTVGNRLNAPSQGGNHMVQDFIRKHGGIVSDETLKKMGELDEEHRKNSARYAREEMNLEEKVISDGFRVLRLKGEMAHLDRTSLEYKQKQVELDETQRDLLHDQKEMENQKTAAQRRQLELNQEMKQIREGELSKFMPTLDELSHRGVFRSQARQALRLERQIKRDFEMGNVGKAQTDLAMRDKIYDSIADRKVLPQREERRRVSEIADQLKDIANGNKTLKVKAHIA